MNTVQAFAIANFVFAGLSVVGLIVNILKVIGVMAEPLPMGEGMDSESYAMGYMIGKGAVGFMLPVCSIVFIGLYLASGFGLMKRTVWGYYTHVTTAILTTFSCCSCCVGCVGFIYTIVALIFAFKDEFKEEFPGLAKS